jgi:DNA helicase HerA-like ATPase
MSTPKPIGIVLGSEDATPLQFWFAVHEAIKVQLDDLVNLEVEDPSKPGAMVQFYGVVDEVRRKLEGIQFEGDTALVTEGLLPANISYAAHVLVTRVEPEEFLPPGPGDTVFAASGEALEKALYLDAMEAPLPAGVLRSGDPAYVNFDFISGEKGAHVNISGISGIATKTSYALFLLYSMFNSRQLKNPDRPVLDGGSAKAVIFNVKGEDLLFLDKPNQRLQTEEARWQERFRSNQTRYDLLGLPAGPFKLCQMHAPARETGRGGALMADLQQREGEGVAPYVWTLHEFAVGRMLPFVLADRDAMSNLGFLVSHLEERLFRLGGPQRGPHIEVERFLETADESVNGNRTFPKIDVNEDMGPQEFNENETEVQYSGLTVKLETFGDLVDFLEFKLLLDDGGDGDRAWTANQAKATREAFIRRLRGAGKHLARLIRGDLAPRTLERRQLDILDSERQVHVVDIHQLHPIAQMFTVGVLLKQIFEQKEAGRKERIFIVLDELNKYAPSEGESPIKDVLLDIAERGRSLGVILIGAQQTASEVERRIVANAAVRVVGRLDPAEAERPEYRFMPGGFRLRSTILAPGTMIVHQPDVPSPMMLTFPFPAWATRRKEVDTSVSDEEALDILG